MCWSFCPEIIQQLNRQYNSFLAEIEILNESEFAQAPMGKWNAGEQLDHLCRSVLPLVWGLRLPKIVPRLLFGKANRPSKTYEELVAKYLRKIADGAKATGAYVPKTTIAFSQKKMLLTLLQNRIKKLCKIVDSFSEEQLDRLILPHPLLGKVTIREMLYFTIYHAEHHKKLIIRNFEIDAE